MNASIELHYLRRPQVAEAALGALAALSSAVLQLHRGSRDWPADTFDLRAVELVQTVLPHHACLWGSVRADAPAGANLALHGLFASGLHDDTLAECLAGHYPSGALLATRIETLVARRVELRLWRTSEAPPFEPTDSQTLEFLLQHLVETQRENRLTRALDGDPAQRQRRSLALSDPQGLLLQADEHSLALLRMEWPRWTGGLLPTPLVEAVLAANATATAHALQPCFGRSITVHLTRCGQGVLLDVRRRSDADRLSTRQRDVAQLYAQGLTGPQIAQRLGLTSSTVNNHLGVVFKKLAVKNKLQLLHAMRSDGPVATAELQM